MRRALLLTLVLALPLEAQLNVPSGISHAQSRARDSLPHAAQTRATPKNRAFLKESVAGIGGALFGVLFMSAPCVGDNAPSEGGFETVSSVNCFEETLIGMGIVAPIGAAFATGMARSVTGTRGSVLASWGGALLGTVIGAGASILVSQALPDVDPTLVGFGSIVLAQGTFAAAAGRKQDWEK